MKKIILLFFVLLYGSSVFAQTVSGYNTRPTKAQIDRDVNAKALGKYKDHFETISPAALISKRILSSAALKQANKNNATIKSSLTDNTTFSSPSDFAKNVECSSKVNLSLWSATVYNIDPQNGMVSCLLAPIGDLNNPIGIFKVYYPSAKTLFSKNIQAAQKHEATQIANSKIQFNQVYNTIKNKSDALKTSRANGDIHLDVPSLFLNTVLTNTNIIDVTATRDLGKLTFKTNVNPSPVAKKIAIDDAETFFNVYSGLSAVSMQYFIILLLFFGAYGLGHQFMPSFTDLWEKNKSGGMKKHTHYFAGLVGGLLLFIPTTQYSYVKNSIAMGGGNGAKKVLAGYDIMQTNWQSFERKGYSIFIGWADSVAKVVIDAEMQSIIDKTGLGTANQIAQTYAGKVMFQNLSEYSQNLKNTCLADYNKKAMSMNGKGEKYKFSNNSSTMFSTDEDYGYAMGIYNDERYMYRDLPLSDAYSPNVTNYYKKSAIPGGGTKESEGFYFFPRLSFAACGRNILKTTGYQRRYQAYTTRLSTLEGTHHNESEKLKAINYIVNLQYQMYNDWGFLAVLGLPITKMQTEMIGGLYKSGNDSAIAKLNEAIGKEGSNSTNSWLHSFFSTIPYMFVPGAGAVFQAASENSGKIGAAAGFTAGTAATGIWGAILGAVGAVTGTIASGAIGMSIAYVVAKTLLILAPIIGIILLGVLRFIIILIKVFTLHFSALFILPVAFAKENIDSITKFTMKVFATMLELPLFVIGIWLAIMANGLIKSIGGYLSKSLILGAIGNQQVNNAAVGHVSTHFGNIVSSLSHNSGFSNFMAIMKLYVFDGFMEIAISVFSIVLIYKIIITFHTMILEAIEIRGVRALDDSIESMRNESAGWGAKI